MHAQGTLCLMLVIASGLALTSGEQKNPATVQQPNRPVLVPQQPNKQVPQQPNRPLPRQPSAEQNQAVVRQVFDDLFTRGRYELIEKVYARECTVHHNNRDYRLEESVAEGKGWRSAAPDLQMVAEQMSTQGDMVTVRWTARGTHTGRGNGLMKPTGKHILIHGVSKFRVVNGKIVEVWNNFDRNEIFRQLGVPPTMAFLYDKTEDLRLAVNRMITDFPR